MALPVGLLNTFRPDEWREDHYVRGPPFTVEDTGGNVIVVARDEAAEAGLDRLASSLGLKKRKQGNTSYLVGRAAAVKSLRQFDWYVRRGWQSDEYPILWAVIHLGERRGWTEKKVSLEELASLTGLDVQRCGHALAGAYGARDGSDYDVTIPWGDRKLAVSILARQLSDLPTWTEEVVVNALCSSTGGSVAEIYESVLANGLSVGALYKVLEKLKNHGYVYAQRHVRVNERGPMRELLMADCRNCFYGYSIQERCLQDTFRQLEDVIRRDFHKRPTYEESAAMFASIKSIPYGSRINRRALASLRMMHEIDRMMKEGRVSTLLKRMEEHYGVEFPVKTPAGSQS